ncbi:unnamed protein product [Peniophora sp. CBMAI 1063]|nr:unnamed protein product [Peniophora sp. CBMAI 1063]
MLALVRSLVAASALAGLAFASPTRRDLPSGDVTCGSNDYTVDEVSAAVSAGVDHVDDPIGSDSYPHTFRDDEGLTLYCSGSSWLEFPILESGTYDGGSPGADRVVFDTDGNYCAVITHTGASETNGFVSCDND